jgi:nitroimidazol reductase NimA-like FMN-containing flavoprotein (pyridoxamine 5'-phosphate oxidase superfamily)
MPETVLNNIEQLIRNNMLCVLATTGAEGPHASLMAYDHAPDCRTLFMFTPKSTRKYGNLIGSPDVSILIDTRSEEPRQNVRALTVNGIAREINDTAEISAVRLRFIERHLHLATIVGGEDIAWFRISVHSFQFLSGIREADHFRFNAPESASFPARTGGDE